MVLGLASDQDSTISHAAIMARSMGIPAVVQLGDGAAAMAVGRRAILDADNGTLVVEPDGAQIARVDCQIALSRLHGQQPDPVAALPCLTKGGTAFRLMQTCNLIDNEVPPYAGGGGHRHRALRERDRFASRASSPDEPPEGISALGRGASPWCYAPAIPAPMMMPLVCRAAGAAGRRPAVQVPDPCAAARRPRRDICVSCSRW